ncbi:MULTISPECIES: type II secretion system ATPase GspE [Shewanella]|jgi:general secretion pathway protein E|uniref:type II secretion system ATPase GspE n=1 Tax=Shewanella TaxID=22 RepID=UPI0016729579|nr:MULTISPECIES: type II secretion system ATPase GspE [Shewanella]MBO1272731.1 type II secretion system ATPase GspE [Shewanella sp. 4t3-1-2LB]MCL2906757.1 type II secretion system ATPase GspE [Shewanella fodinae]GGZ02633.1 type II secretion system protein GspE [Shewanella fodinae]
MSEIETQTEELTQVSSELGLVAESEGDELFHSASSERLPFAFAHRHGVVLSKDGEQLVLFYTARASMSALLEARRYAGCELRLQKVDETTFEYRLTQTYQSNSSEAQQLMEDIGNEMDLFTLAEELPQTEDLLEGDDDAPIIRLINALLSEAIKEEASDIHIETYEKQLVIRFRIDGVLREVLRPNRKLSSLLVSRIKVMARLDIAEKRVPQDGRISLRIGGRAVDVRVSTMPSSHGERVVLRLLDKNAGNLDLVQLGMTEAIRVQFEELLRKPHGIILVTGPTGSGKSTTLYAGLTDINHKDINILTVEDPIEYEIEGIGQTQVNTKVDMTFARGLRAILRQDPDVVMIGEIRDLETAQIAVQASLTGHLVLSTLHTNTASGAITRLQDMGVEPFLVSSSLLGVLAQRLVRTLCDECKEPHLPSKQERELLGLSKKDETPIYRAKGCKACGFNGYKGRTGIHELLLVDDKIRELIHGGRGELAIEKYIREFAPSIRHDGMQKVLAGITTLEEVLRVTREE